MHSARFTAITATTPVTITLATEAPDNATTCRQRLRLKALLRQSPSDWSFQSHGMTNLLL